jgi:Xaa-Pro dipeptidase
MRTETMRQRLERAQEALRQDGFDAMIVIKPEHVRYLAGVWGYSTRPEYAMPRRLVALVLPSRGEPTLVVPKIELLAAQRQSWLGDVRHHVEWAQEGEVFGGLVLLAGVLKEKGLAGGRLALETGFVSARLVALLGEALPGAELADPGPLVETLRMIKSAEEIAIMRIAGGMAVREFEAEARVVKPGIREFEIAVAGREAGTRAYAEALAQSDHGHNLVAPIVDGLQIITSGERLDMVHALASSRAVAAGDMVLLDFCRYPQFLGYRIGFSRVVSLRQPSAEERDIWATTMAAFAEALKLLRPGVPAEAPDLAARDFLEQRGLGATFVHRTGRGVGLEGVERPEIGAGDKTPLAPGMVVTVEPSVYFPNFAVHVEDTFLITPDGHEPLTPCSRDLRLV